MITVNQYILTLFHGRVSVNISEKGFIVSLCCRFDVGSTTLIKKPADTDYEVR